MKPRLNLPPASKNVDYIYALVDPRTGNVRYIGATSNPRIRLSRHLWCPPGPAERRPVNQWVAELRAAGLKPEMVILEECTPEEAYRREHHFLAHYREQNADLLNLHANSSSALAQSTDPGSGEFITALQAANRLACSGAQIRIMCQEGEIRAKKVGRDWIIRPEDLDDIVVSRPSPTAKKLRKIPLDDA